MFILLRIYNEGDTHKLQFVDIVHVTVTFTFVHLNMQSSAHYRNRLVPVLEIQLCIIVRIKA